jgi:hypothetical protein
VTWHRPRTGTSERSAFRCHGLMLPSLVALYESALMRQPPYASPSAAQRRALAKIGIERVERHQA